MFETHSEQDNATLFHWRYRAATLVLGALIAAVGVAYFFSIRVTGDEATLTAHQRTWATTYNGVVIAARRLDDYQKTYVAGDDPGPEGLWMGNSQLHTINEYHDGDETSTHYASEALGWPTWCLSLPLVTMREEYVILNFALSRRKPDVLILQLTFNTFRIARVREQLSDLVDEPARQALLATPLGRELVEEMQVMSEPAAVSDAIVSFDTTLQQRAERALDLFLSSIWPVWRDRGLILTAVRVQLGNLRNWVFRITPSTKRPMIRGPYERNMAALETILDLAQSRGIPTVVYICPIRQEIELPYIMSEYEPWKSEVAAMCKAHGAVFEDLDSLVSDTDLWGRHITGEIDFMHFTDRAHAIVGRRIADLVRPIAGKDER